MSLATAGLPSLAIQAGFVILFSAPVWLGAKVVGADYPTLWRSILSLLLGIVSAALSVAAAGAWSLLLVPLAFLLSFKYVLGTSFIGAVVLALVAILGYAAMVQFIGAGVSAVVGSGAV